MIFVSTLQIAALVKKEKPIRKDTAVSLATHYTATWESMNVSLIDHCGRRVIYLLR